MSSSSSSSSQSCRSVLLFASSTSSSSPLPTSSSPRSFLERLPTCLLAVIFSFHGISDHVLLAQTNRHMQTVSCLPMASPVAVFLKPENICKQCIKDIHTKVQTPTRIVESKTRTHDLALQRLQQWRPVSMEWNMQFSGMLLVDSAIFFGRICELGSINPHLRQLVISTSGDAGRSRATFDFRPTTILSQLTSLELKVPVRVRPDLKWATSWPILRRLILQQEIRRMQPTAPGVQEAMDHAGRIDTVFPTSLTELHSSALLLPEEVRGIIRGVATQTPHLHTLDIRYSGTKLDSQDLLVLSRTAEQLQILRVASLSCAYIMSILPPVGYRDPYLRLSRARNDSHLWVLSLRQLDPTTAAYYEYDIVVPRFRKLHTLVISGTRTTLNEDVALPTLPLLSPCLANLVMDHAGVHVPFVDTITKDLTIEHGEPVDLDRIFPDHTHAWITSLPRPTRTEEPLPIAYPCQSMTNLDVDIIHWESWLSALVRMFPRVTDLSTRLHDSVMLGFSDDIERFRDLARWKLSRFPGDLGDALPTTARLQSLVAMQATNRNPSVLDKIGTLYGAHLLELAIPVPPTACDDECMTLLSKCPRLQSLKLYGRPFVPTTVIRMAETWRSMHSHDPDAARHLVATWPTPELDLLWRSTVRGQTEPTSSPPLLLSDAAASHHTPTS